MSSLVSSFRRGAQRLTLLVVHYRYALVLIATSYALLSLLLFALYRLALILNRPKPAKQTGHNVNKEKRRKGHLLVVLGSGGHTSEILSILQNLGAEYLNSRFDRRTWVVSSGDAFSAERTKRFEEWLRPTEETVSKCQWDIVTVHRARKIHQPIYTAPFSGLQCLWDCIQVLRGTHRDRRDKTSTAGSRLSTYPDLILTNGPATAVILIIASVLLMFLGLAPISPSAEGGGAMRSIYIESWARVKTLSLSGKILRFMVGRFLVQWRGLEDADLTRVSQGQGLEKQNMGAVRSIQNNGKNRLLSRKIEYVGAVVT